MKAIVSSESSNVLPLKAYINKKSDKNPPGKRKKRKCDSKKNQSVDVRTSDSVNAFLSTAVNLQTALFSFCNHNLPFSQESYIVKVEQLARIKQKQEEDKACVRLHSFK